MDTREDIQVPDTQIPEVQSEQPTSKVTKDELLTGTKILTDSNEEQKESEMKASETENVEEPKGDKELTDKVTQAKEHSEEVINHSTKEF